MAVPKGNMRQQQDKDSKKAESSEMVQAVLAIAEKGHICALRECAC